jgi:GTPase SAR1 family protein
MSSPGLKILVVGPSKSRKSQLVNYLAGVIDTANGPSPGPTVSARILEGERNGVNLELWDVSGDQSTEAGWPAIQKGADAVLLVYNPEIPGASKECELWAQWFGIGSVISSDRCLCYNLSSAGGGGSRKFEGRRRSLVLVFATKRPCIRCYLCYLQRPLLDPSRSRPTPLTTTPG